MESLQEGVHIWNTQKWGTLWSFSPCNTFTPWLVLCWGRVRIFCLSLTQRPNIDCHYCWAVCNLQRVTDPDFLVDLPAWHGLKAVTSSSLPGPQIPSSPRQNVGLNFFNLQPTTLQSHFYLLVSLLLWSSVFSKYRQENKRPRSMYFKTCKLF